jgi:tetratricopeptide (TPR) repeat protein
MEESVSRAIRTASDQARLRPSDANAAARLGMLYNANFLTGLSVSCYERAIELDPRNPQWHYLLALASADVGDAETAESELGKVLALSPDHPAAMFHLGQVLLDTGRTEQAGELFERLTNVSPDSAGGYYGLGRVEYRRKHYERAKRLCEEALQRSPDSKRVKHQLGLVYRRLGRESSNPQLTARAEELLNAPYGEDPVSLVEDAWRDEVGQFALMAAALFENAKALRSAGRLGEAADLYEEIVRRHPDHWGFVVQLADLLYAQGRKRESRSYFERATKIAPQSARPWGGLAEVCRDLGDHAAACSAAERAAALAPDDVAVVYLRGRVFMDAGRLEESITSFRKVLEMDERHAGAAVRLADALNRARRHAEALDAARKAVALQPDSAYAHFQLASALDHTGDWDGAKRELETTLSLQPSSTSAKQYLEWIKQKQRGQN